MGMLCGIIGEAGEYADTVLRQRGITPNKVTGPGIPGTGPGVPGTGPGVPGTSPGVPGAFPWVPGTGPGTPGPVPKKLLNFVRLLHHKRNYS